MIGAAPVVVLLHLPVQATHSGVDHVLFLSQLVAVQLELLLALLLNESRIFLLLLGAYFRSLFLETSNYSRLCRFISFPLTSNALVLSVLLIEKHLNTHATLVFPELYFHANLIHCISDFLLLHLLLHDFVCESQTCFLFNALLRVLKSGSILSHTINSVRNIVIRT